MAFIPISGSDAEVSDGDVGLLAGRPLIEYTLHAAFGSRLFDRVIVSTDSETVAADARALGAEVPFLRPESLANPRAAVTAVLEHALKWLEEHERYVPDWAAMLMVTYPFRRRGFIDSFIETVLSEDLDSAFAAAEERHSLWMLNSDREPKLVSSGIETPKAEKRVLYRELSGLITMTMRHVALEGHLYGRKLGIVATHDAWAMVNVHDPGGRDLAGILAPQFQEASAL